MAKRKGLPKDLNLLEGTTKPEKDKPIRAGDYLDEMMGEGTRRSAPRATTTPEPASGAPVAEEAPEASPAPAETPEPKKRAPARRQGAASSAAEVKRTRLNVSMDGRKRLSSIVDRMKRYGPEPDVRASEVLEAAILALYEAQEHLDLSNVRRRGKYGSASHKNFPVALAESVKRAIAEGEKVG